MQYNASFHDTRECHFQLTIFVFILIFAPNMGLRCPVNKPRATTIFDFKQKIRNNRANMALDRSPELDLGHFYF